MDSPPTSRQANLGKPARVSIGARQKPAKPLSHRRILPPLLTRVRGAARPRLLPFDTRPRTLTLRTSCPLTRTPPDFVSGVAEHPNAQEGRTAPRRLESDRQAVGSSPSPSPPRRGSARRIRAPGRRPSEPAHSQVKESRLPGPLSVHVRQAAPASRSQTPPRSCATPRGRPDLRQTPRRRGRTRTNAQATAPAGVRRNEDRGAHAAPGRRTNARAAAPRPRSSARPAGRDPGHPARPGVRRWTARTRRLVGSRYCSAT